MRLNVSGPRAKETYSLRNYISTNLGKLEKHFDYPISSGEVYAVSKHAALYAEIDQLANKFNRQLFKKRKSKRS